MIKPLCKMPIYNDPTGTVPTSGGNASGWFGALAGASASVYDTYQSSKTARENTNKTIAANQAEAEKAYQREIEMWNMMNAYNDPSAQMARYQAAGLNPHMVGQSGTGSGNASTMPKYNPPNIAYKYEAPQVGNALSSILPMVMQVGTWMQSMKFSEEQIKGQQISNIYKLTQDEKARQAIEYLEQANPELIQKLKAEKRLSLYRGTTESYKSGTQQWLEKAAYAKILAEYGSEFATYDDIQSPPSLGGFSAQRRAILSNQIDSGRSKARIDAANAAYADYGITNPQQLINLVAGSVLSSFKGTPVRINQGARKVPKDTRTYKQKYESIKPRYQEPYKWRGSKDATRKYYGIPSR